MNFFKARVSVRLVCFIGLVYLVLPYLLFLVYWVKPVVAIIGVFFIVGSLISVCSKFEQIHHYLSLKEIMIIVLFAYFLLFFSGVGGYSYQVYDYFGHNTKLGELSRFDWPYAYEGVLRYPCYYFGYYLVPSFLVKHVGSPNIIVLIWSSFGLSIGLMLTYVFLNKSKFKVFLVFFSGGLMAFLAPVFHLVVDILPLENELIKVGFLLLLSVLIIGSVYCIHWFVTSFKRLYLWSLFVLIAVVLMYSLFKFWDSQFLHKYFVDFSFRAFGDSKLWITSSNISLIWAPNQLIPSVLVLNIILICSMNKRYVIAVFFIAFSLFWSPFTAITNSLILSYFLWIDRKLFWEELLENKFKVLSLLIGMLPLIIYFLGSSGSSENGLIWDYQQYWIVYLLVFVFFELGIFLYVFRAVTNENYLRRSFVKYLVVLVGVMSLFRLGVYNDFLIRGGIPVYLAFWMIMFKGVDFKVLQYKNKVFGVLMLIIILFVPVKNLVRGIIYSQIFTEPIIRAEYADMYRCLQDAHSQKEANQYLLKSESLFEQYLLRKGVDCNN